MDGQSKHWCDTDDHRRYEHFADFNDWLEGDEGLGLRDQYGLDALNQPSKAFYAGDREAYEQAFQQYQIDRRHEALSQPYFEDQFGDNHWYQRSHEHFMQLLARLEAGQVVPFIGAGISALAEYPSWKDHLRQQGRTAGIDQAYVEKLLGEGGYETIIEEIEELQGRDVFVNEIRDVFSQSKSSPEVLWRIVELFDNTVITTNYDRLIEQAYESASAKSVQLINGVDADQRAKPGNVTVYKLHGGVDQPTRCILGKNQYDQAYGNGELERCLPIPKLLAYHYQTSSLLFLGSSLNDDRTVQVFRKVKESLGDTDVPQHFSIEQVPADNNELTVRNAYLAQLGITPIWFEQGCFDSIENILQLAKHELGHRGMYSAVDEVSAVPAPGRQPTTDMGFSQFLGDFVDLMPLLHWFHRPVPQSETKKYLGAMQRVFHAHSLFTEGVDSSLLSGIDNVLRAISNQPRFDGYSHGKLSTAFSSFQEFLITAEQSHYADSQNNWELREMLVIPRLQFESLIETENNLSKPNQHAIRVTITLLHHGLNQLGSPNRYCDFAGTVSTEFNDYAAWALTSKLAVITPDRLNNFLNEEIQQQCEDAWLSFEKPVKFGVITNTKLLLQSLIVSIRS